ncbi:9569_t:CDS:2, partial [Scutellospora calospora]
MSQSDSFPAISNQTQNLEQFHSKLKLQSLEIINQIFPRKILELNNLLQNQSDGSINNPKPSLVQNDNNDNIKSSRKRRRNEINNDPTQTGEIIKDAESELHKILEYEVACFAGYCCKLRAWVTIKYPRIGTEENPKVSAQEDITAELSRVENSSFLFLDSITRYYIARAKLC